MDANSSEPHCAFLQNRTRDVDELELESDADDEVGCEGSALPSADAPAGTFEGGADDREEGMPLLSVE